MPFLLLYIQSLTNKDFKLSPVHLLHALPFLLVLSHIILRYTMFDAQTKRVLLRNYQIVPLFPKLESSILSAIGDIQKYSYLVISLIILRKYRRKLKNSYSSYEHIKLLWLSNIIICFLGIEVFAFIKHSILILTGIYSEIFTNIILLSYLYLIMYILYKGMQYNEIFAGVIKLNGKQAWSLPQFLHDNFENKLKTYMEKEKPYLIPSLTLEELSNKLSIESKYLSMVINKAYNKNFFNFINSYRIKEAQKLLIERNNEKNILEILYEVGFNNKSVFNDCCRRYTGLTPTEY